MRARCNGCPTPRACPIHLSPHGEKLYAGYVITSAQRGASALGRFILMHRGGASQMHLASRFHCWAHESHLDASFCGRARFRPLGRSACRGPWGGGPRQRFPASAWPGKPGRVHRWSSQGQVRSGTVAVAVNLVCRAGRAPPLMRRRRPETYRQRAARAHSALGDAWAARDVAGVAGAHVYVCVWVYASHGAKSSKTKSQTKCSAEPYNPMHTHWAPPCASDDCATFPGCSAVHRRYF